MYIDSSNTKYLAGRNAVDMMTRTCEKDILFAIFKVGNEN